MARDLEKDLVICEAATNAPWKVTSIFTKEAREGWPYAIRRALEAEAEVDRLRDEIQMLQEQLQQRCARA